MRAAEMAAHAGGAVLPGPVVAIAGPTASGKSALAARVARTLGSPLVSADAMQVYRGMDIGTAKDVGGETELLMVDVADVGDEYSVALYQRDARACVDGLLRAGIVPIVCGGTGLYLDAVLDDMSFPAGHVASPARRHWERYARERGAGALHDELARRDAEAARLIHPNNVRRVVRALELADAGVSYAEQNRGLRRRRPHYAARVFALSRERARLYARIDRRVDDMVARGLVDEVARLAERGLSAMTTAGQAIGYKEMLAYLDGTCSLAEAVALIKSRTRHYAKRQLSWLRRRNDIVWLDMDALSLGEAAAMVCASVADVGGVRASCDGAHTGGGC